MSILTDSPGFHRLILDESEELKAKLAAAYLVAKPHNHFDTQVVSRTPGANFNPRPLRIAQLILLEVGQRQATVLAAGILYDLLPEQIPEQFQKERALIKQAQSYPEQSTEATEAIFLAAYLDTVRHLHLIRSGFLNSESLYRFTIEKILPLSSFVENRRLRDKLTAWAERYQRSKK